MYHRPARFREDDMTDRDWKMMQEGAKLQRLKHLVKLRNFAQENHALFRKDETARKLFRRLLREIETSGGWKWHPTKGQGDLAFEEQNLRDALRGG